jgi:chorismate mutase
MDLNDVRLELIDIENKLVDLLEKRVNLGVKVAEAKYPKIKNEVNQNNILELIEDKNIENKVLDRIKNKCEDPRLKSIMVKLYKDYLIPKNKEIQVEYIKNML